MLCSHGGHTLGSVDSDSVDENLYLFVRTGLPLRKNMVANSADEHLVFDGRPVCSAGAECPQHSEHAVVWAEGSSLKDLGNCYHNRSGLSAVPGFANEGGSGLLQ